MKAKIDTLPFVIDLSPITCFMMNKAGTGLIGFTAIYSDGSFKNISLAFNPETEAAAQSEIICMKQILEQGLASIPAAKPKSNEINLDNQKRRPT